MNKLIGVFPLQVQHMMSYLSDLHHQPVSPLPFIFHYTQSVMAAYMFGLHYEDRDDPELKKYRQALNAL